MSPVPHVRILYLIAFACVLAATSARPAEGQSLSNQSGVAADSHAHEQLTRILGGLFSDTSVHMRMGPTRTATVADSTRAAAIVLTARTALRQYVDVKVAERDGYYRNMPWLDDQPIYHYNNQENIKAVGGGAFDLTKPVSLLYKKDTGGQLRLVGAMYATSASEAKDLDALLPISMAHWHEHVNLCYPTRRALGDGPRKVDDAMVFWVKFYFSMTSEAECEDARGQFVPVEFGWMAHVYMFAGSDDPHEIWDADDLGNMPMRMHQPPGI